MRLSRRGFLLGGLGAVSLVALGGGLAVAQGVEGAIERTLRRLLGDFRIPRPDMARFMTDYLRILREREVPAYRVQLVGNANALLGNPFLRGLLPRRLDDQIRRYERHLLTRFTLGTTFFEVVPKVNREIGRAHV